MKQENLSTRHSFYRVAFAAILLCMATIFVGCDLVGTETEIYTIQYVNEGEIESIEVADGELFNLPVATKEGYDFLGYFDAEVGGVQYTAASGACLTEFADKKDLMLYARFAPKTYQLVFNTQNNDATSSLAPQSVFFGEQLRAFPLPMPSGEMEFVGWFTEEDGRGIKISNEKGVATHTFVDSELIRNAYNGIITLYAYYEYFYNVTLYRERDGQNSVTKRVARNTNVSDIGTFTNSRGKVIHSWSTKKNDVIGAYLFNGFISGDMTLYACQYEYTITLTSSSGLEVNSIQCANNAIISLPKTSRTGLIFAGWRISDGTSWKLFEDTVMPDRDLSLREGWYEITSMRQTLVRDASDEALKKYAHTHDLDKAPALIINTNDPTVIQTSIPIRLADIPEKARKLGLTIEGKLDAWNRYTSSGVLANLSYVSSAYVDFYEDDSLYSRCIKSVDIYRKVTGKFAERNHHDDLNFHTESFKFDITTNRSNLYFAVRVDGTGDRSYYEQNEWIKNFFVDIYYADITNLIV